VNVGLITEAAKTAALERLSELGVDVAAHIAAGLEAHANTTLLDVPYKEGSLANGDIVSPKTLRIQVTFAGQAVSVDVPALNY
jgi:hypothetical protein